MPAKTTAKKKAAPKKKATAKKTTAKKVTKKTAAKKKPAAKKVTKKATAKKKPAKKKAAAKKPAAKKAAKKAAPKKKATKRKASPALMKPVQPDAILGAVVGPSPMPRGQITKKLWDYIKKNNLQDATNKRMINADETLKKVFDGKAKVDMFTMTKLVSKHIK